MVHTAVVDEAADRRVHASLLSAQLDVLAEVVSGRPLDAALGELIRVLESVSPEPMLGSVLLLDPDGRHLRHCAAPSLPRHYNRAVDGIAISASAGSCGTAAYHGRQVIVTDIATDALWADYRELALAAGLRACWSTPLVSDVGTLLGTFALYYPQPKAPSAQDLDLISVLGRTVTMAIQRSQADTERDEALASERAVALALQRRLLPQVPSTLAGVQLATAYRTGDPTSEVGGDWYDAVAVDGVVYLVIGDVQGHDLEAAALMGQLRTVVRAYALEGLSPGQVLANASRYWMAEPTERIATACVVRLDPVAGALVVASAGHPAPLQLYAASDGSRVTDDVAIDTGPPLGLAGQWPDVVSPLPSDAVLLLYTDGAVESRSWSIDEGLARLRSAVQTAADGDLDALLTAALTVVPVGRRGDDVTLLAARVTA